MRQHKIIKDEFSIQIISLGERTGDLAGLISLASTELEAKRIFYNKLFGSLLYPACVVSGTFIIALSLVFLIFPKVLPIFSGLGVPLPLSTRFLMWSIDTTVKHWLLVSGSVIFFLTGLGYLLKKHNWRIPLIKRIWLSRVLRIIGLTTKSGMPLDQSVSFCANTLSEIHYKKALQSFDLRLKEGESIGRIFSEHPKLFPTLVSSFVMVGERSSALSESLIYLSTFYQNEVEGMTKRLTELIEPALMIVLGLAIGFIGVSLITPIYSITNHVTH